MKGWINSPNYGQLRSNYLNRFNKQKNAKELDIGKHSDFRLVAAIESNQCNFPPSTKHRREKLFTISFFSFNFFFFFVCCEWKRSEKLYNLHKTFRLFAVRLPAAESQSGESQVHLSDLHNCINWTGTLWTYKNPHCGFICKPNTTGLEIQLRT